MRDYKRPVFTTKHYWVLVEFLAELQRTYGINEDTLLREICKLFKNDNKKFREIYFKDKYDELKELGK